MAYQSRRNRRKVKLEEQCQYFVTEARTHPNGFTVYKVIRKVATPGSFDCFKESIIWKRYSDFKELYKIIASLHKKLYLNGKVPSFAKPKLFGRFEEGVISERRQSAQELLDFIIQQPPLLKSAVFKEFFVGCIPVNTSNEIKYLKQTPLKPIVKADQTITEESGSAAATENQTLHLSAGDLEIFDPFLSTKEFIESTSTQQDEHWIEQVKKVFSDSQEENKITEALPVIDDDNKDLELIEALKIDVTQTELENYYDNKDQVLTSSELSITPGTSNEHLLSEISIATVNSNVSVSGDQTEGGSDNTDQTAMELKAQKLFEIDRAQHRKSSKASAYLEAIQKLTESTADTNIHNNTSYNGEDQNAVRTASINGQLASSENKSRDPVSDEINLANAVAVAKNQCFDSDDYERGAYLSQASQQISFARTAEKREAYEEAFGHYKAAINTLLQGVQGDTDESRIQAVRRKTATYLKHAETLHATHLKATLKNNDLWRLESNEMKSSLPKTIEVTRARQKTSSPVIPSPRHKSQDLSFYKVLGTVGKVLLVLDTRNNESYVFKILPKSCKNRLRKGVIPTNVPFMVRLHRYYSTDNAVCLLIEHAAGGRLWEQLASYFETAKTKNESTKLLPKPLELDSIRRNESSTPIKISQNFYLKEEKRECEVNSDQEEQCSSFLDLCMEYRTEECCDAIDTKPTVFEDESEQCNDNPDNLPLTENEILEDNIGVTHVTASRSLSCLSWDEGSLAQVETTDRDQVFGEKDSSETPGNEVNILNFKSVSSTSDIRLFTIDPEDSDTLEDSIYDTRSVEGSDADNSSDEQPTKEEFTQELLSEQDMSAVSLLGDNIEKTLNMPKQMLESNNLGRSSSPLPSHISEICKDSPCLSMNSSFDGTGEEDNCVEGKMENGDDKNVTESSVVTRVVDENGVSSVDAVSLFRTHSRTKSLDHSKSISAALQMDNRTVIKNKDRETMAELGESLNQNLTGGGLRPLIENNIIHSIFVKMDAAKEKCQAYRIPEATIRMWAAEMVIAVGTLHSVGILCRDLNPNNILLSADGHIRLSYFGKWKQVERQPSDVTAVERMYVAPEVNKVAKKKTEACDWWSVGAILYELFTARPLYIAHPSGVTSHTILPLPEDLSAEATSLLTGLLQYHPPERLGYGLKGLDDLMNHPFFEGVEWEFLIEDYVGS